jgi:uncharacterized protein YukE
MNYNERPTELQEQASAEVEKLFAEHLAQFKANCDAVHNLEQNLGTTATAVLQSPRRVIQTDDGAEWQQGVDLLKNISLCHRRTAAGLEFAVVECLPLKAGEMKDVLNSGHNAQEVLQKFARDQRQILQLWKGDLTAQVSEHLAENYPHQDMSIVAESFDIKLARAISQKPTLAQSQSRGVRI